MEEKNTQIEIVKPEAQLVEIIKSSGLEKTKAEIILDHFTGFFKLASEWEAKAREIVITDVSQVEMMKKAREARLALSHIRGDAEEARKALKEQSLREGKAIDGIANVVKAVIVPIEKYLESQEKFAELKAQEALEKKVSERISLLSPFVVDVGVYNLVDMTDAAFDAILTDAKTAFNARKEAEEKAEKERQAKLAEERAEQERIKAENERLKKEADAKAKADAVEKAKHAAEVAKIEAQRKKEADARAKAEAELLKKQEADKKAKQQEQLRLAKEAADKLASDRAAAALPDKNKLIAFADAIKLVPIPGGLSQEAMKIAMTAVKEIHAVALKIKESAKKL